MEMGSMGERGGGDGAEIAGGLRAARWKCGEDPGRGLGRCQCGGRQGVGR